VKDASLHSSLVEIDQHIRGFGRLVLEEEYARYGRTNNPSRVNKLKRLISIIRPVLAASVLLASFGVCANAQDGKSWFFRIGPSNFMSKGLRTEASRNGLDLGLGLVLPKPLILKGLTQGSFELDLTTHRGHGVNVEVGSIDYVERLGLSFGRHGSFGPYIGLGVGIHRDRYSNSVIFEEVQVHGRSLGESSNESANKTVLGGKIVLGANLSSLFFVEGAWVLNGKTAGDRFDAANVTLGIRF